MTAAVRFTALGDSVTEGVGDPVADGWRGWAAMLAPGLSPGPVEFRNLANSGALSHDLTTVQLPAALALRPTHAAVLIGGNDTLRAGFDIARTARHLDTALAALRNQGAVLLTACLPDPGRLLRLPPPLARPLARRMRAVNTVVHALSLRYGATHLHLADLPWLTERSLLSVDRLHPSAAGHHRIACEFHALLTAGGERLGDAPAASLSAAAPGFVADLRWMATQGTRWVAARCTDLLPGLLLLATRETRHLLLGTSARLDTEAAAATAAALRAGNGPAALAHFPTPLKANPGTPSGARGTARSGRHPA
ncbi:SGNH/GDSL hydrolase family protein [Kitasatospora sp. NPDC048540]|uniref:SGNH/GDSL hydrolase family protein n=1 Tax=unclassified Kitasatospora TaxID=2633591 RepID=UPI0007C73824|nr:SGNH/GDSL hydrolase family protein [Kitasatospora sp. MBT63]